MFFTQDKKTVDSVLVTFNKVVDDLAQIEADQLAEIDNQNQIIAYAEAVKVSAQDEANKAKSIRSKILKLVTV